MGNMLALSAVFLVALFFLIVMLVSAIKIVPEHQRAVVFRLGRCIGYQGPGIILLIPFIDLAVMVDLREQTRSLAASAISADNLRLTVDISWNYKVIDPTASVLQVGNFEKSLENIVAQFWPAQVEAQFYQDVLKSRPDLKNDLLAELRRASTQWGIEITGVQLGEIRTGS